MVSIRPILKVCLSAMLIWSTTQSLSRCSNDYMYQTTSSELKYSKPQCREIEQKIREMKELNMPRIMKYVLGKYGKMEAMEYYRESHCKPEKLK